jgi:hypothetical protein
MLLSDLHEKIELAQNAFGQLKPGVRHQASIDLIKDNLRLILWSLHVPAAFKDVCKEQIKLVEEFCGPTEYKKQDADKIRQLINRNFEKLRKIAAR